MSRAETRDFLLLGDKILEEVAKIHGLTWCVDDMMIHNKFGQPLNWDDMQSWGFKHGDIVQINFWGDGTLEFQTTDGESTNWAEFDKKVLKEILNKLINIK